MTDAQIKDAQTYGFDRIGSCSCMWGSRNHGDRCPEHGTVGAKVPTKDEQIAELTRQRDELLAVAADAGEYRDVIEDFAIRAYGSDGRTLTEIMSWLHRVVRTVERIEQARTAGGEGS